MSLQPFESSELRMKTVGDYAKEHSAKLLSPFVSRKAATTAAARGRIFRPFFCAPVAPLPGGRSSAGVGCCYSGLGRARCFSRYDAGSYG